MAEEHEQGIEHQETSNDIVQLRDLIFGDAKRDLESRVNQLEADVTERFNNLEQQMMSRFEMAQQQLDASISQLEQLMADIDKKHVESENRFDQHLSRTQVELEQLATSSKDESQAIIKKIQTEARLLTDKFSAQYQDAVEQLEAVADDLSAKKTDKNTLAELLRTVAMNLEQDGE